MAAVAVATARVLHRPYRPESLPFAMQFIVPFLCFSWVILASSLKIIYIFACIMNSMLSMFSVGPPLWSSGQSFWLQIQRSRVRFPALPDFLSSIGSGTGST